MNAVEVHFDDREARVWQVIDPGTEMLLDEGEAGARTYASRCLKATVRIEYRSPRRTTGRASR